MKLVVTGAPVVQASKEFVSGFPRYRGTAKYSAWRHQGGPFTLQEIKCHEDA